MKAKTGKLNQGVEAAFIGLVCLEGDQCHKGHGPVWQAGCSGPKGTQTAGGTDMENRKDGVGSWGTQDAPYPALHLRCLRWTANHPTNFTHS